MRLLSSPSPPLSSAHSKTMSKRTWLIRLLSFLFALWSGLALIWLFLPSPGHDDDCITLPSNLINEHKEFTRIYETARFFPPLPSAAGSQHPSIALAHALNRSHFALSFTIDPARQYLIINAQQRIALQNANALERFSAPIPIIAPVGDAPSSLSLFPPPCWSAADGGGPMEIWPDGDSWDRRWLPPRGVRPLLTVSVVKSEVPNRDIIVSAPPLSVSPSRTYAVRARVFAWVAPVWWAAARVLADGGSGLRVAGAVAVRAAVGLAGLGAVTWLLEGRPAWGVFREGLLRDVARVGELWGRCGGGGGGGGGGTRDRRERVRLKNQSVDLLEKGHGILSAAAAKEKG
ncbi:hypothetical protein B0J12DRAFT_726065 [Macrophomina phaseolina]|uniref:Uncharacterized protein n=1 Tax=Macrophomina phaseolina TaxID=35725 RepID=A0ABQ8GL08_9PEZI|nr:hypothetical protein B0J12DRAFT_726065 [Macrophomina phaseolina]